MKKRGIGFVLLIASGLTLSSVAAAAEQPVGVRPQPRPDQKLRVSTSQKLSLRLGAATQATPPQMESDVSVSFLQANRKFDAEDHMEAVLTLDEFAMRQTMNGVAKPAGDAGVFRGRQITAILDRSGRMIDLKISPDLQQAANVLRQLIAGAFGLSGFLPATPMTTGQTVTAPASIPMRLPGAKNSAFQANAITKLVDVKEESSSRIALVEQQIESGDLQDRFQMKGKATVRVDLNRGYIRDGETEWTFTEPDTRSVAPNGMGPVNGTIRVTVTATEATAQTQAALTR